MKYFKDLDGGIIQISKTEYLLMFLFFILLGFPSGVMIPYKTAIISVICVHYWLHHHIKLPMSLIYYVGCFIVVSLLQEYFFGISDLGNILQMSIAASLVSLRLGYKFRYAYLNVLLFFCVISLLFYIPMALFHILPPRLIPQDSYYSVFVYNVRMNEIVRVRNCGPFWEPGAFAGYICILFILFFDKLELLWKVYRCKILWILMALITTFSTQGYLILFGIIVFYSINKRFSVQTMMQTVILSLVIGVAFVSLPILGEKVDKQLEASKDTTTKEGQTNLSRFSTAAIDLHYVGKHPLIGNTTHPSIRYSDHPFLQGMIEYNGGNGTGSGMTDFMATYGIVPILIWMILTYKSFKLEFGGRGGILCLLLIIMLGNAECYFIWIGYHVFPFLVFKKNIPILTKKIKR